MKSTYILICCFLLAACHHKDSACLKCAKTDCKVSMQVCERTPGCKEETACILNILSDSYNEIDFEESVISCFKLGDDKADESSAHFLMCLNVSCDEACNKK